MKVFNAIVFASVACWSSVTATWSSWKPKPPSSPADTCSRQFDCIDWQVRRLTSSSCNCGGSCAIEVCLVLNLNVDGTNPKCVKSSGTISHGCDMADANGCPRQYDSTPWDNDSSSSSSIFNWLGSYNSKCSGLPDGFKFCQQGKPGDSLNFIL